MTAPPAFPPAFPQPAATGGHQAPATAYPPPATGQPGPPAWTKYMSNGKPYWANSQTGETTWQDPQAPPPPPDPVRPPPAAAPATAPQPQWKSAQDVATGRTYWYNTATQQTTWVDPFAPKPAITSFFAKGYLTQEEKANFWQAFNEIGRLVIPSGLALKAQPNLYDPIANAYIQMDRGNDNVMRLDELNAILKEIGMFEGTVATYFILREMDFDGRGTIQLHEFVHEMVVRANEKVRGLNMGGQTGRQGYGSAYAGSRGGYGDPYGGGYGGGYGGYDFLRILYI